MCRYASNGQRNCFAFAAANNKIKGCSPVLLHVLVPVQLRHQERQEQAQKILHVGIPTVVPADTGMSCAVFVFFC